MNFGPYSKTVTALVTGLIGWATAVATQAGGFAAITSVEWIGLVTVVAVAFGVFTVPNAVASAKK